jgi:hypothetical protein
MLDSPHPRINAFAADLEQTYRHVFGAERPECGRIIAENSRLALGRIAASDMRYHNVEHTMLVTSVGQQILIGKRLATRDVSPTDWMHFILALLCHDIGYVRGVCRGDATPNFASGNTDGTVTLPEGSGDASLTAYHVSRSELFVREQFGSLAGDCDPERIASYIEMTRFPPPNAPEYRPTGTYAGLARAADFIGQFGDPNYLRKLPALFSEFEQIGSNEAMGYRSPDDMRTSYGSFFRDKISPYLHEAVEYLRFTVEGRQWIANLELHLREVEHPDA